jgi:N6-L-threonylcarbamoyladenine synthase
MYQEQNLILGIETSCDETAVALVTENKEIIAQIIYSQAKEHSKFGGIVPEIAARNHIEILPTIIEQMFNDLELQTKQISLKDVDAIAVTAGPGLIGGVIVGVMFAKGLASALNIPCMPINHLAGHALSVRLSHNIKFPYCLLLVSGGHCQLVGVESPIKYHIFGTTRDDAVGEVFDKVSRMLNLGYPGGPAIEERAKKGDVKSFSLPRPLCNHPGMEFSFSGIKTAVMRIIEKEKSSNTLNDEFIQNICASFQYTIAQILANRIENCIKFYNTSQTDVSKQFKYFAIAGGVAANQYIQNAIRNTTKQYEKELIFPPLNLCTDNAAMIAWAGIEMQKFNRSFKNTSKKSVYNLDFTPKSRWPLNEIELK